MFKITNDNLMILHMITGNTEMKADYFDESFQTPTIKIFKALTEELSTNANQETKEVKL
jgi:hypothetical protein